MRSNGRDAARRGSATRRRGFTILELLVVIAIIGILLALLLPAVAWTRESSRHLACRQNLHQIGLALHGHHEQFERLPPGWARDVGGGASAYGWAPGLLPFLDAGPLRREIRFEESVASEANAAARRVVLPLLLCPSDICDRTFALPHEDEAPTAFSAGAFPLVELPAASYVGIFGTQEADDFPGAAGDGAFIEGRGIRWAELTRGLSHTVIVSERTARRIPSTWLGVLLAGADAECRLTGQMNQGPNRPAADECELDSRHPGVVNALWGDGHVQSLSDGIDPAVYRALGRRAESY